MNPTDNSISYISVKQHEVIHTTQESLSDVPGTLSETTLRRHILQNGTYIRFRGKYMYDRIFWWDPIDGLCVLE